MIPFHALFISFAARILAAPTNGLIQQSYYDVEGHRGGRGETTENTLPAFAQALIEGVTTLEMDNGITKDGVVVVWHDEQIVPQKCKDTGPAFKDDPLYPYVGKYIANLTFAQISTLDCGATRLSGYPLQVNVPKTRIASQKQVFDMVACADPLHLMKWNIESKVGPVSNITVSPEEFVKRQLEVFSQTAYYRKKQIVYQSFDWRTIQSMANKDKNIVISALVDSSTSQATNGSWPWLANIDIASFPGATLNEKIVQAAHSIKANIVSPSADFVTQPLIDTSHSLGMQVVPWTVNDLNVVEKLVGMKVDGIISDYPYQVRRWAKQAGLKVAPQYPEVLVQACLKKYT